MLVQVLLRALPCAGAKKAPDAPNVQSGAVHNHLHPAAANATAPQLCDNRRFSESQSSGTLRLVLGKRIAARALAWAATFYVRLRPPGHARSSWPHAPRTVARGGRA